MRYISLFEIQVKPLYRPGRSGVIAMANKQPYSGNANAT